MDLVEAKARGFETSARHPWETARVDVVGRLIRQYAPLRDHAIVLDIGCGDTFVVEQLSEEYPGATFYAVDTAFTPDLVEHYRARLHQRRILPFPSLDSIDPPLAHPASLVLLMDVIEHIEDDRAFLGGLRSRSWVGIDTRFLITVPAFQSLFSSHDTFLGHYRRYSNATLRRLVEASGFTVIAIGYFFGSLLPLRLLQVLKERVLRIAPGQPSSGLVTWRGSARSADLLRSALTLDARLSMLAGTAGVTLPGLSNYAICAKSA